jgi:hypothetical protein
MAFIEATSLPDHNDLIKNLNIFSKLEEGEPGYYSCVTDYWPMTNTMYYALIRNNIDEGLEPLVVRSRMRYEPFVTYLEGRLDGIVSVMVNNIF